MAKLARVGTTTPGRRPGRQKAVRGRVRRTVRRKPQVPYGWAHVLAKRALLAAFRDGQPCPRCHRPMRYYQKLDAGHVISRALGGGRGPLRLEHARCNRSAGATLGNRMRSRPAQVAGVRAAGKRAAAARVKSKWAA